MTEITSSQENLPLSQETFSVLWSEIPAAVQDVFLREDMNLNGGETLFDVPNITKEEVLQNYSNLSIVESSRNCAIPAIDGYPGYYDFKVFVPSTRNVSKASTYLYSMQLQKVFIKINTFCPFNFYSNQPLDGYVIRATLHFNSRENAKEVVERCINHSHKDAAAGDYFSEHLVKCESLNAQYFMDPDSKRYSVAVPFENAPSGQNYTTYLYKFTCYTSCSGGPNRRPFCVVFTLEKQGMVVGRSKVDLKICAGPHRDMKAEEESHQPPLDTRADTRVTPAPAFVDTTQSLKRKRNPSGKEYVIKVKDEECYRLLSAVKKFFYLKKLITQQTNWEPTNDVDIRSLLHMLTSSSEDDKEC